MAKPGCDPRSPAPPADAVAAAFLAPIFLVFVGLTIDACTDDERMEIVDGCQIGVPITVITALPTTLFTAGAFYGFGVRRRCEEAHQAFEASRREANGIP